MLQYRPSMRIKKTAKIRAAQRDEMIVVIMLEIPGDRGTGKSGFMRLKVDIVTRILIFT